MTKIFISTSEVAVSTKTSQTAISSPPPTPPHSYSEQLQFAKACVTLTTPSSKKNISQTVSLLHTLPTSANPPSNHAYFSPEGNSTPFGQTMYEGLLLFPAWGILAGVVDIFRGCLRDVTEGKVGGLAGTCMLDRGEAVRRWLWMGGGVEEVGGCGRWESVVDVGSGG